MVWSSACSLLKDYLDWKISTEPWTNKCWVCGIGGHILPFSILLFAQPDVGSVPRRKVGVDQIHDSEACRVGGALHLDMCVEMSFH